MAHRQAVDESQQPIDRTALLLTIDGKDARNGTPARHHGKALAFSYVTKHFRETLVRVTCTDRSVHAEESSGKT